MIENAKGSDLKASTRALYCPNCALSLTEPGSFVNEYWESSDVVYFCWCSGCGFRCEINEVTRVEATEPEED